MIILDATTRSLEIDLNAAVAANQLPFVASYVDISQSTFAMSAMSTNTGASNSTTAVTLVAAPGATTSRQLKYLSIKNSDTVSTLLWVQMNDNSTLREIWKGTLAVGDTLVYVDSLGFNVVDSSGGIKSSLVNTLSTLTLTSTLTMSGTAANIALGSNYISNGGTDAGLSFDGSNNAVLSGSLTINGSGATTIVNTTGLSYLILGDAAAGTYSRIALRGGSGKYAWAIAAQDLADNSLTITPSTATGGTTFTTPVLTIAQTGNATLSGTLTTSAPTGGAGAWELGIANVVSPTSPNRTITIEIGGTAYYLAAKTTND